MNGLQWCMAGCYFLHACGMYFVVGFAKNIFFGLAGHKPLPPLAELLFYHESLVLATSLIPLFFAIWNQIRKKGDMESTLAFIVATIALGTLVFWTVILSSITPFIFL